MQCPKCDSEMETIAYDEVEVDRCTSCRGLWLDALEKDDLLKLPGAESIDAGDAAVGERQDRVRAVDCPKCGVAMLGMVDMVQSHIRFESCPTCYGTFFDAGEFRDLKEITVIERVRELVGSLRR